MRSRRNRLLAYLALLANSILWSMAIPFAKLGFANGLTPTAFLFSRFLLAVIFSLPVIFLLRKSADSQKVFKPVILGKVFLLELVGTFLALWLLYEGVARTSVIEAALISISWPIFVTIGGVLFFGEKESRFELGGLILAVLGSIVIVLEPLYTNGLQFRSLTGNLMILSQNIAVAAYYLWAKKTYRGLNKWTITHLGFWVGAIAFALVILARGSTPGLELTFLLNNTSPWPIFAVIYMGTFGSILATTLYLIGQDKIEASEASLFTYLQPVFTIPFAVAFLGEKVGLLEIIGGGIIVLGLVLAQIRRGKVAK